MFYSVSIYAQEAVILLHGLCRSKSSMEMLAKRLNKEGYYVLNVDYPSRTNNIGNLSESAIGKALTDPEIKKCSKINFISHSMGGILIRCYLKNHKIKNLGRIVMLAPPNKGSEVVDYLKNWRTFKMLNGPAGNELGTDENSIPNTLGAADFELGIIAGDRTINFINSFLMIPGSDDGKVSVKRTKLTGMKEHITIHTSHPFIMKNDKVIDNTVSFLKKGHFIK